VVRATNSVIAALLVALVLLRGPCFGCVSLLTKGGGHACCHGKKGCAHTTSSSQADCVSAAVELARTENTFGVVSAEMPLAFQFNLTAIGSPTRAAREVPVDPVLNSPPDLCLLHSILTI